MNHSGIHIKRNEYPGERWLFVKVYGSPTICDRLVAEALCPKLNRMRKAGLASRWFFVRFSDPGYHLRLRIELNHPALQVDVLNSINKSLVPLCEERLLHKLSIDTYERELERYGSRHMDLTETLFCIDSECISKILGVLCHRGIESERWKLAFAIADRMMDAFDLSVNEKRSLSGDMSRAYLREFGFNEHNIKIVAAQYRKLKVGIDLLLQPDNDLDGCRNIVNKYGIELRQALAGASKSGINLKSLLHMSMNRLFATKNRLNEMMLHYSLERHYTTEIIRHKMSK